MKSKPTHAGDKEHGAEVVCLHEDDNNHQGDPDFFPIKLAYNGIHHYLPIVQRSVCTFLDDYNSAMYHIKNARYKLKKLNGHMPEGCTLAKVVKIAYTTSVTTAEVLNGCNPLLGTTGAEGAAPITLFDFPKPTPEEPSSGRKRKRATAAASVQSTSTPAGDDPEEGEAEHEPNQRQALVLP